MKWTVMVLFVAAVYAQSSFGPEYDAVEKSEQEMDRITKDIKDTMRGIPNTPSAEFACLQNMLIAVGEVNYSLRLYKFSVAMWHSTKTDADKRVADGILKVESDDMKGMIQRNQKYINETVGAGSQLVPKCVAKGTELLGAIKKADDVLTAILNKTKK